MPPRTPPVPTALIALALSVLAPTIGQGATAMETAAMEATGGDVAAGAALFQDRCAACHDAKPTRKPGPPLAGVVGRTAGTWPGYEYSPALKAAGIPWTAENLDRWLQGPTDFIPNVNMMAVVGDAGQRRDIIAYLKTLAGGR